MPSRAVQAPLHTISLLPGLGWNWIFLYSAISSTGKSCTAQYKYTPSAEYLVLVLCSTSIYIQYGICDTVQVPCCSTFGPNPVWTIAFTWRFCYLSIYWDICFCRTLQSDLKYQTDQLIRYWYKFFGSFSPYCFTHHPMMNWLVRLFKLPQVGALFTKGLCL